MDPTTRTLNDVFFALSDGTRRGILSRLSRGQATIGELAEPFDISAPAVTKHLKILERAGLIERRIDGRRHHCSLSTANLQTAEDWLNFHRSFWEARFDALEDLLTDKKADQKERDDDE